MTRRFVLLDRDGTINEEVGYVLRPDELRLLPGAAAAVRELRELGLGLVVVTNQSPVVLTGIRVSNREAARPVSPFGLERLELSYRDYTLALDFAALTYTGAARNRYAYRLEGFDDDWIDAGTRRQARYAHLEPGLYTFRVRAANSDGVWNEEGAAVKLTVLPPSEISSLLNICRRVADSGRSVVLVTHNPDIAARCDRTKHMLDGRFLD